MTYKELENGIEIQRRIDELQKLHLCLNDENETVYLRATGYGCSDVVITNDQKFVFDTFVEEEIKELREKFKKI